MNTPASVNRNTSSSSSERESFSSYCKKYGKQSLLDQWDHSRNSEIDPDVLSAKSHQRVWWKCEKGHEWQAQVNSRVRGARCPVCTNRVVAAGENDLATVHPVLAAQWHDEKTTH